MMCPSDPTPGREHRGPADSARSAGGLRRGDLRRCRHVTGRDVGEHGLDLRPVVDERLSPALVLDTRRVLASPVEGYDAPLVVTDGGPRGAVVGVGEVPN